MSNPTGALLLALIMFGFNLFMLIYSMASCSSLQDRLFLVTDKGGKTEEEKKSVIA